MHIRIAGSCARLSMTILLAALSTHMAARAESLLVIAVVEPLGTPVDTATASTPCSPTVEPQVARCDITWQRYRLTRVAALDGTRLADAVALLQSEQQVDGPKLLELQALDSIAAQQVDATYKVLRFTTLFSAACVAGDLVLPDGAQVLGPTRIEEYGDARCYLLPLWWAK